MFQTEFIYGFNFSMFMTSFTHKFAGSQLIFGYLKSFISFDFLKIFDKLLFNFSPVRILVSVFLLIQRKRIFFSEE